MPKSTLHVPAPPGLHVAIIMDGNGRWATLRGRPRSAGHRAGARNVRRIVEAAPALGIGTLTLYAFSSDNWQRPAHEVTSLMRLFAVYLRAEVDTCLRQGVRLSIIGRRDRLAPALRAAAEAAEAATSDGRVLHLRVALDYSAREAIARAAHHVASAMPAALATPEVMLAPSPRPAPAPALEFASAPASASTSAPAPASTSAPAPASTSAPAPASASAPASVSTPVPSALPSPMSLSSPVPSCAAFARALGAVDHSGQPSPDVDLLIRTGGEQRLSDFLLWECAYAELYFTGVMWPDFTAADLAAAVQEFHARERRFGRVAEAVSV